MSKGVYNCIFLSILLIDSTFKMGKSYFFKGIFKMMQIHYQKKRIKKYISNDVEISSDDSEG